MFWRRLLRIAIGGVVCALLVLATGWLVQRVALGVDDAGMRMRVEAEVRSAFDRMARRLRTMAVQTSDLPTIRAALDGDTSCSQASAHQHCCRRLRGCAVRPGIDDLQR